MKTAASLLFIAAALMVGTSADAAPSSAADQCFFTRDIQNYLAPDDHTLYLRGRNNAFYRIDLSNQCPNLDTGGLNHISLQTVPGSPTICSAIDLDLRVSGQGVSEPCIVKSLHKLTPDEVAALPKKDKP